MSACSGAIARLARLTRGRATVQSSATLAGCSGAWRRTRSIRRASASTRFEPPARRMLDRLARLRGYGRRAGRRGRRACRPRRPRRPAARRRLGELLELEPRVGFPQPVLEQVQHAVGLLVMLVLDLADDFLDHVLDRDQALGAAEFVDDDGEVDRARRASARAGRARPSIRARTAACAAGRRSTRSRRRVDAAP